jgi:cupin 2 domain-containing protein
LVEGPSLRVERIVSHGHASPEGFWYDQEDNEWVLVLRGRARLRLADADSPIELAPGDYLAIPPHRRHRVEWTTPDEPTVWLAIHYV